eukprot:5285041-Pleurochrysis_carterae.AAC.3
MGAAERRGAMAAWARVKCADARARMAEECPGATDSPAGPSESGAEETENAWRDVDFEMGLYVGESIGVNVDGAQNGTQGGVPVKETREMITNEEFLSWSSFLRPDACTRKPLVRQAQDIIQRGVEPMVGLPCRRRKRGTRSSEARRADAKVRSTNQGTRRGETATVKTVVLMSARVSRAAGLMTAVKVARCPRARRRARRKSCSLE